MRAWSIHPKPCHPRFRRLHINDLRCALCVRMRLFMRSRWLYSSLRCMRNRECFWILCSSVFAYCLFFSSIFFSFQSTPPVFTPQFIEQLKLNVYHYAELLFRWQIYHKRLELLKAVTRRDGTLVPIRTEVNRIGMFDLVTCFRRQRLSGSFP